MIQKQRGCFINESSYVHADIAYASDIDHVIFVRISVESAITMFEQGFLVSVAWDCVKMSK